MDLSHRGWYSRGYLPHLDSPFLIQHITYHLADSLPREALERLRYEVKLLPLTEEKRKEALRKRIEKYLDAGHGACILKVPEIAVCVMDTWFRFDGERYRLIEWVVMPNHCHVLIETYKGFPLRQITLSWKNFTARFINRYNSRHPVNSRDRRTPVRQPQRQRPAVWARESWDRFIRDNAHFEWVRNYIMMNPVSAGLVKRPEEWRWSSAAMRKVINRDE